MLAVARTGPRRARGRGQAPAARAPIRGEGQALRLIRQRDGEDPSDAVRRARGMPWWPAVVRSRPTWSGGWWVFVIALDKTSGGR